MNFASSNELLAPLDFTKIHKRALAFVNHIEQNSDKIIELLLEYESYEVACDEMDRTLDLLKHLHENEQYFSLRVGKIVAFLPRNQIIYALTCFVIVPSLMATEVHFRIPHCMKHVLPKLLTALRFHEFFPNVIISSKKRLEFLQEYSALRINPKTKENYPVTDGVIFTGTYANAERLRLVFDKRTLFIANCSGHNPVVVAEDASILDAATAVLTLQLYNQGQDCAAPNSILVHQKIFPKFLRVIRKELSKVKVGCYRNRSCRVGPISDPDDLIRIQQILIENRKWLDPDTPGIIRSSSATVEPTIICKPLKEGGNYHEVFAPIIFLQKYNDEKELASYFNNSHYAQNAMYVTLYGTDAYIRSLVRRKFERRVLHDKTTILINTHLHAPGIERGTKQYGGYGYGASSISINGKVVARPTLPQRDIFENLVWPLINDKQRIKIFKKNLEEMIQIEERDVGKIFRLHKTCVDKPSSSNQVGQFYIDTHAVPAKDSENRYRHIGANRIIRLLNVPNITYLSTLDTWHLSRIRTLYLYLLRHKKIDKKKFEEYLFRLAQDSTVKKTPKKQAQALFFADIYNLLFGLNFGPRLTDFLIDADRQHVLQLLNV